MCYFDHHFGKLSDFFVASGIATNIRRQLISSDNSYHNMITNMLRRAFQMTLELFAEASLKKLLYAVSMVANCVTRVESLLESNRY